MRLNRNTGKRRASERASTHLLSSVQKRARASRSAVGLAVTGKVALVILSLVQVNSLACELRQKATVIVLRFLEPPLAHPLQPGLLLVADPKWCWRLGRSSWVLGGVRPGAPCASGCQPAPFSDPASLKFPNWVTGWEFHHIWEHSSGAQEQMCSKSPRHLQQAEGTQLVPVPHPARLQPRAAHQRPAPLPSATSPKGRRQKSPHRRGHM